MHFAQRGALVFSDLMRCGNFWIWGAPQDGQHDMHDRVTTGDSCREPEWLPCFLVYLWTIGTDGGRSSVRGYVFAKLMLFVEHDGAGGGDHTIEV